MIIEWDADCVDDHGEIPEPGDVIDWNSKKMLIKKVNVVNKSKVEMLANEKSGIGYYDDPTDISDSWEEIDDKYLHTNTTPTFQNGLFPQN